MSKITLGKPPKTFAPINVSFKMPDGSDGVIECIFKYRSRKAFGEFLAGGMNALGAASGASDVATITASTVDQNGAYLVDILDSWNLDEPLSLGTAVQLADEVPAAVASIMVAYRHAVTEGRLGN